MPLSLDEIRAVAADAVSPRHFFVGNGLELEWEHAPAENIPWEIYKCRLLDASQTRERRTFEAWNIYSIDENGRSTEPILSLKLDAATGELHVVRAILCYAWEAYDAGDNVIESRETTKWVRELVVSLQPADFHFTAFFSAEAYRALQLAVIGASRLPLTSVEAPLPAFSLGQLGYFQGPDEWDQSGKPFRSLAGLIGYVLKEKPDILERTRLLEVVLRASSWEELPKLAEEFALCLGEFQHRSWLDSDADWPDGTSHARAFLEALAADPPLAARQGLRDLINWLFNEAALTPYTDLVEKALSFVAILESQAYLRTEDIADLLGRLLRQLGRHLTAYDLVTFHHRGANYPDALLLDAVLKAYLRLVECEPALFLSASEEDEKLQQRKRLRRRALRQAWLLRRRYEGHLVPDSPTSPGENLRVLTPPHGRVPDEQIVNPASRTKRLYQDDPLDKHCGAKSGEVLRQSIDDLHHPAELRELGTALFLDRPFGGGKGPMEPDGTLLFSYVAFSRSVARARLQDLASLLGLIPDQAERETRLRQVESLEVGGIPVIDVVDPYRQAIVSLADALRVAEDFVLVQSTSMPWFEFEINYLLSGEAEQLAPDFVFADERFLLLRVQRAANSWEALTIYDAQLRKRAEMGFDPSLGWKSRNGNEFPACPLHVLRVWLSDSNGELREHDLRTEPILLQLPRR